MGTTLFAQRDIAPTGAAPLVDRYGRHITYLRVSVTDRCDFRCVYCMSEDMQFLPKKDVLSFEEIDTIVGAFVARGVRKVRLTGGEPLVRRDIMELVEKLGGYIGTGLEELTLTTNGSQLAPLCGASRRSRRPAHQCLARYARREPLPRRSLAAAGSPTCSTASTPRPRPASRSRSTWSRCAASTTTRSSR